MKNLRSYLTISLCELFPGNDHFTLPFLEDGCFLNTCLLQVEAFFYLTDLLDIHVAVGLSMYKFHVFLNLTDLVHYSLQ